MISVPTISSKEANSVITKIHRIQKIFNLNRTVLSEQHARVLEKQADTMELLAELLEEEAQIIELHELSQVNS